jgi:serine/threonine protein kinase
MEAHEISTCVNEFAQEVNMMRKLRHPNIVQFFGAWLRNPPYLLITDFCSRGSIISVLEARKGKPFSQRKVLKYALHIAAGMSYLHSLKPPIIHRDLKPGNLLIDEQGNLKIADFGLAKIKPRKLMTEKYHMTGETGSYRYMAPEVFRHEKEYTEKVDQYSFAIIVWEMLEGQRYMEGVKAMTVAVASEAGSRPQFSAGKNYPEGLPKLLHACWADDPRGRPDFTDIVVAMEHIIEKKPLDKACVLS